MKSAGIAGEPVVVVVPPVVADEPDCSFGVIDRPSMLSVVWIPSGGY